MEPVSRGDLLVVGAGPVGLYTALALSEFNVPFQLVDKDWRTGAHSYALALHGDSLKRMERFGLSQDILAKAYRVNRVGLYDGSERRAELVLANRPGSPESLAVLRQDSLERLMEQKLRNLGVPVLWNHEVSELDPASDGPQLTVDRMEKETVGYATARTEWMVAKTYRIQPGFVIGADGHRSIVRRSYGASFDEVGPAQHFAVFEFKTDADLENEMRIVLGERTMSAVWPLPDGYCRWSFQLDKDEAAEESRTKDRLTVQVGQSGEFSPLGEPTLRRLLAERAPWFQGQVEHINWRIAVRFEQRMASSFVGPGVALAGDSGHMTGPVGMQSMNVGFREADQLVGIAARAAGAREPIDELATYNGQRLREWRFLLNSSGGLSLQPDVDPWIRQHAARILPCIPASGETLVNLATQIGLAAE